MGIFNRRPNVAKLLEERDIKGLVKALGHKDDQVVASTIEALGRIGEPAVTVLIEELEKADSDRYWAAVAKALGEIDPDAKAAVPALIGGVKWGSGRVQCRFAPEALGRIGPDAKAAVPALIEEAENKNNDFRNRDAWALGEIGPDAKAAVPALIRMLKDKTLENRSPGAAHLLGPELTKLLKEEYYRERWSAAEALGKIGDKAAVPALTKATLDKDEEVRKRAKEAIENIQECKET